MWARMYHLFIYKREEYMEHYHKRRNIETAYSMIKGKFGSAGRSKSDTGQTNEALCEVLAHNVCVLIQAMHAFNVEPLFAPRNERISLLGNVVLLIRWRFLFSLLPPPIFVQDSRLRFLVIYGYSPSVEGVGSLGGAWCILPSEPF
jgi:hypothetical protein